MFKAIKTLLSENIGLEELVTNFKRACWRAVVDVFTRINNFWLLLSFYSKVFMRKFAYQKDLNDDMEGKNNHSAMRKNSF